MNKKILSIVSIIVLCGAMLVAMTGCGKKDSDKNNNTNIETEKINTINDFAKYINNNEVGKVANLIDIGEYSKISGIELDKEQLETILERINVNSYEISNVRKATEDDIRNIAEEYGTYENFMETYKDYEKYAVDYKLSIDGSSEEAKDIFFIKEENGTYSLVISTVWQGLINYNYITNNRALEGGESTQSSIIYKDVIIEKVN